MSSENVGFTLLMISFALIFISAFVTIVVPRRGPRKRRYNDQRAALTDFLAKAQGSILEFDWFRFGEVPKPEIIMLAGEYRWEFDSDKLTDDSWTLRFKK